MEETMVRLFWSRLLLAVLVLAFAAGWATAPAAADRIDVGSREAGDTNWGH
ncbi:hypothetical protein ABGB07_33180 [Micromonosporaceae bacterium B7E4]